MTTTAAQPSAGQPSTGQQSTGRRHSVFHRLRVSEVERLTDDAVAVTFAVPPELAEDYRFRAGQHVNVRTVTGAGDDVRRSYSICASPGSGRLRIAVKRIPDGAFSSYALETLAPGDEIDVMTPAGRFTPHLDPGQAKHYAALTAGSGITPVLSIVAAVLETEPGSRVTLLYGNRTSRSVMFLEDLEDLKDRYLDRFHLAHVLSREEQDGALTSGRLDRDRVALVLRTLLPPDTVDEWFLCGPYDMVVGARDVLVEHGVDRSHVHAELFHVGDTPPPPPPADAGVAGASEVTVVLDGRRTSFDLPPAGPAVLDAVLGVRSDAPFACKGGVCGTCRAKVLEGSVRMDRNYALEESEVERGYVLTCQSHPTAQRVVLDFDA
ncbi:MAG TPA: 1,2-phenylacetyl-CoA epoxidase subunit PaaE [Jiangellales bacterium]|nr:1,2-phenylacetyl-CoA epoxidase subunit PaaE [Jiangellales bacterium]